MEIISNNSSNNKVLGEISSDFVKVADLLKEAAYQVKSRKFSEYPIFPICEEKIQVGQELISKEDRELKYNYNITYLDEFVQRGLIDDDKIQNFKDSYKNIDEFCCLFVVSPTFTNIVYIPYPED